LELVAVRDFDFAHVGLGLRRFEDTSCSLHSCREPTPQRVPGGGASEWLPALVGRLRALEIIIGANDFDAATAVRYGWMNRSTPDANSTASWMIWHRIASYQTRTIDWPKRPSGGAKLVPRGEGSRITSRRSPCAEASVSMRDVPRSTANAQFLVGTVVISGSIYSITSYARSSMRGENARAVKCDSPGVYPDIRLHRRW